MADPPVESAATSFKGAEVLKWQKPYNGYVIPQYMDYRPGIRQSFDRSFPHQIGNENDLALGCCGNFQDTDAANLKPSAKYGRRRCNQSARLFRQYDLIVGNKLNLVVEKGRRTESQSAQSEVGFSGPGRAADQDATAADRNRCRVDALNRARQARHPVRSTTAGEP